MNSPSNSLDILNFPFILYSVRNLFIEDWSWNAFSILFKECKRNSLTPKFSNQLTPLHLILRSPPVELNVVDSTSLSFFFNVI